MSVIEQGEEYPRGDAQPWVDAPELDQLKGVSRIEDDGEGGQRYYHSDYELTYKGPNGELSPMIWDDRKHDWVDCPPHYRDDDVPPGAPNGYDQPRAEQVDGADVFDSDDGGEQANADPSRLLSRRPWYAYGAGARKRASINGKQPGVSYASNIGDGPVAITGKERRKLGEKKHRKLRTAMLAGGLAVLSVASAVGGAWGYAKIESTKNAVAAWLPHFGSGESSDTIVNIGKLHPSHNVTVGEVDGSNAQAEETTWTTANAAGHEATVPGTNQTEYTEELAGIEFEIKRQNINYGLVTTKNGQRLIVFIDPSGKSITSHTKDARTKNAPGSEGELKSIYDGLSNQSGASWNQMVNSVNSKANAALLEANKEKYGTEEVIAPQTVDEVRSDLQSKVNFLRAIGDTKGADTLESLIQKDKKIYVEFRSENALGQKENLDSNPNEEVVGVASPVSGSTLKFTFPGTTAGQSEQASVQVPGSKEINFSKSDEQNLKNMENGANYALYPKGGLDN